MALSIWKMERNLLVFHPSPLTTRGCMGPRSIQEEILRSKKKWPFGWHRGVDLDILFQRRLKPKILAKALTGKSLGGKESVSTSDPGPRNQLWSGLNRTFPNIQAPLWLSKQSQLNPVQSHLSLSLDQGALAGRALVLFLLHLPVWINGFQTLDGDLW